MRVKSIFGIVLALSVVGIGGCGGGSSSDSGSNNGGNSGGGNQGGTQNDNQWQVLIDEDPATLSDDELVEAYWGYAQNEYTGLTSAATISESNAQVFYSLLIEAGGVKPRLAIYPGSILRGSNVSPYYTGDDSLSQAALNTFAACGFTNYLPIEESETASLDWGYLHASGDFNDGVGTAEIVYSDCVLYGGGTASGEAVIRTISPWYAGPDNYWSQGYSFFKSLELNVAQRSPVVSGFVYDDYRDSEFGSVLDTYQYSVVFNDAESGLQARIEIDQFNNGNLAIGSEGSAVTEFVYGPEPQIFHSDTKSHSYTITGAANSRLSVSHYPYYDHVLISLDSDGDGLYDLGRYYLRQDLFLSADLVQEPLRSIDEINFPPFVRWGHEDRGIVYLTEDGFLFDISSIDIIDPDTDAEALEISAHWTLNGEDISDLNDFLLPAELLVDGLNTVSVYFTVFDGTTLIRSQDSTDQRFYNE